MLLNFQFEMLYQEPLSLLFGSITYFLQNGNRLGRNRRSLQLGQTRLHSEDWKARKKKILHISFCTQALAVFQHQLKCQLRKNLAPKANSKKLYLFHASICSRIHAYTKEGKFVIYYPYFKTSTLYLSLLDQFVFYTSTQHCVRAFENIFLGHRRFGDFGSCNIWIMQILFVQGLYHARFGLRKNWIVQDLKRARIGSGMIWIVQDLDRNFQKLISDTFSEPFSTV